MLCTPIYNQLKFNLQQFWMDLLSLLPLFVMYSMNWECCGLDLRSKNLNWWTNMGLRLLLAAPLTTILIQLLRSCTIFVQPPQAQPFNATVLFYKYLVKVALLTLALVSVCSLFWIVAGCRNR